MMTFGGLKAKAENGPGALVSRTLTLIGTAIAMPVMIYLLMQVVDRSERTYEVATEMRQEIRSMQSRINRLDSRLTSVERRDAERK